MQAAPHVTVQAAAEHGPAAITASALESAGLSDVLPESSYACVGDVIDVSMQDGFLRCGDDLMTCCCVAYIACPTLQLRTHPSLEFVCQLWRAA